MTTALGISKRLGLVIFKAIPKKQQERLEDAIMYSGMTLDPHSWLFLAVTNSLLLAVLVSYALWRFVPVQKDILASIAITTPIIFLVSVFGMYNILMYYGLKRSLQIEEVLPDALQLISANIRAGLPIQKALLSSARKEFGLFAEQLELMGKEINAGLSVNKSFENLSKRVKSPLVRRVTMLMEESLRSGHDLGGLLDEMAHDMRVFRVLEEEVKANIGSYVLFIVLAVVIIAPVLYSVSITFIDFSSIVKERMDVGSLRESGVVSQGGGLLQWMTSEQAIATETLILFSAANIVISATSGAVVVSVLQTGDELQKLPLIPVFIAFSLTLFLLSINLLKHVLGGFFA
ncbi:MAG: type II secretion system F family protein [Candidatus Diapherotrites archaeon]|nr:type II secretion system F family protein [Candidatus Diapherotrites archaeon]